MSVSSTKRPDSDLPTGRRGWANRTVIGAGITSEFGDFAYETTNVILPGFLAVLGVPAVFLGTIEGVADALMSFTKLAAGHIVNRIGHRKALVVVGYALTPVGQALIALALGWPLLMLGRCVSWFGKGLRGPLRDAIIAEAVTPETKGRAFGFHRTMDIRRLKSTLPSTTAAQGERPCHPVRQPARVRPWSCATAIAADSAARESARPSPTSCKRSPPL